MSIQLTCGSCRASVKVKEELAGKRVKCPRCAKLLPVPAPALQGAGKAAAPAPPAPAEAAPLLVACSGCGLKLKVKAGKAAKCPKCGRAVKAPAAPSAEEDGWIDITEAYRPPAGQAPARVSGDWGQELLEALEIPEEMQTQVRDTLGKGEHLVWCDRPRLDILMDRARKQRLYGILLMIGIGIVLPALAYFMFRIGEVGAMIGGGVVLFMLVVFEAMGVFMILAPGRLQKNAANRSCYALTNRRLLIHPGKGTQTYVSEGGNQSNTVVGADEVLGVLSYSGLELLGMQRIEDKKFEGAGELVLRRNVLDEPVGGRLTALGDVRAVEKRLREQLLHPMIDKLLRGELSLKDGIGIKKKDKDTAGEILSPEKALLKYASRIKDDDDEEDRKMRRSLQKTLKDIDKELRAQAEAELTDGEELLWLGTPEGSTQGRGMLGAMIGSAKRKEPSYTLYALTTRRVLLWAKKGAQLGNRTSFGRQQRGPVTYYPPALVDAGLEDDDRIPKGGSIVFKQVQVTITSRDKQGKTTTTRELHVFGILRIPSYQAVARVLFATLVGPVRRS